MRAPTKLHGKVRTINPQTDPTRPPTSNPRTRPSISPNRSLFTDPKRNPYQPSANEPMIASGTPPIIAASLAPFRAWKADSIVAPRMPQATPKDRTDLTIFHRLGGEIIV